VAWALDGGAGRAFAGRVGEADFNPDTVARYRTFLAGRYETLALLAHAWRRPVPDLEGVLPPGDLHRAGEVADWPVFLDGWWARARGGGLRAPGAGPGEPGSGSPESAGRVSGAADFCGLGGGAGPPFAVTEGTARGGPLAGDERPLTLWRRAPLGAGRGKGA